MIKNINRFKVLIALWAILLGYCALISTNVYFNAFALFFGFLTMGVPQYSQNLLFSAISLPHPGHIILVVYWCSTLITELSSRLEHIATHAAEARLWRRWRSRSFQSLDLLLQGQDFLFRTG